MDSVLNVRDYGTPHEPAPDTMYASDQSVAIEMAQERQLSAATKALMARRKINGRRHKFHQYNRGELCNVDHFR